MNDSDSDDQDYVPSGAESEEEDEVAADNDEIPDEDEAEKKKTEALWADFMADVEPVPKKRRTEETEGGSSGEPSSKTSEGSKEDQSKTSKESDKKEGAKDTTDISGCSASSSNGTEAAGGSGGEGTSDNKIKVKQVFDFAGEKIVVEKELDKDSKEAKKILVEQSKAAEQKVLVRPKIGGGLSTVVGQVLNKKNKMSILEKSKLDWDGFKKTEGITEELANHNRGKDGYLEKMAFLERTDLRQFDIEKAIRDRQRSSRSGNM